MRRFAQLCDFIIRYIDNEQYGLDNTVGLDPKYPYPQIIYIPDDPDYCKPYNNGQIKFDAYQTQKDLKGFNLFLKTNLVSYMVNRFLIQQLSLPNDSHLNPYFTNISLISPIFLV